MPGIEVWKWSSTMGPPVTGLRATPAFLESSFSGINPTESMRGSDSTSLWDLGHTGHLGAFEREASCHDQAHITRAQHYHAPAHGQVAQVHVVLHHARGEDPGGAMSGNTNGASGPLPTSHAEDHRLGPNPPDSLHRADC